MTHSGGKPHTNVGDRGQRYEVRAFGYPKEGQNVIGWSDTLYVAGRMASGIKQAPGCTGIEIYDRVDEKVRIHSGALLQATVGRGSPHTRQEGE